MLTQKSNETNDKSKKTKLHYALAYAGIGWHVFPVYEMRPDGKCACGKADCKDAGKHPRTRNGFDGATTDEAAITRWWTLYPNANIAVHCARSGLVTVDVDPRNGGDDTLKRMEADHGEIWSDAEASTGGDGQHFIYNVPDGFAGAFSGKAGPGIDIKHKGYFIVEPSNHKSGGMYQWVLGRNPLEGAIPSPCPAWLLALAADKPEVANKHVGGERWIDQDTQSELRSALGCCDADDRDTWVKVGMVLRELGDVGFELWDEWSKKSDKYRHGETRQKWNNDFEPGGGLSYESVFHFAGKEGWNNPNAGSSALDGESERRELAELEPSSSSPNPFLDDENLGQFEESTGLSIKILSDYWEQPKDWIIPGYLPRGQMVLIGGRAGAGKSTLATLIASFVTRGEGFPNPGNYPEPHELNPLDEEGNANPREFTWYNRDGTISTFHVRRRGSVLFYSSEESVMTVRARIRAAGGDDSLFGIFDKITTKDRHNNPQSEPFSLSRHVDHVIAAIEHFRPDLVILDNVADLLAKVNGNSNNEVRPILTKLSKACSESGTACIAITHFNKASAGQSILNRVNGSVAIGAVFRGLLGILDVKGSDDEMRVIIPDKFNESAPTPSIYFRIVGCQVDIPRRRGLVLGKRGRFSIPPLGKDEIFKTKRIEFVGSDDRPAQEVADEAEGLPPVRVQGSGGNQQAAREESRQRLDDIVTYLASVEFATASQIEAHLRDECGHSEIDNKRVSNDMARLKKKERVSFDQSKWRLLSPRERTEAFLGSS